jgi:hypothetical protein
MTSKDGHGGSCGCATCAIAPFTRNNYFTGKLLLERDFTDEQQYFRDKIRHHNRRLHGTGVVCGLLVSQHPNAGCRDRLVRLSPGTAIDCCGNEILVVEEQDIDLSTLPALADLPDDGKPHDVRLCLRYHECGDEPIPVLYDECAWDDDRCQPNRILEGWRMDAVIDPPTPATVWRGPALARVRDVPLDDASVVVVLDGGAIAVADGTRVQRVEADATTPSTTKDLGGRVHGLELAAGGRLYATHDDGSGALTVSVLEASDLSVAHAEPVAGSAVPATTGLTGDGRLLILQPKSGTLTVYGTDLEAGAPAAPASVTVDADRALLAVHPSSAIAYIAAGPSSADAAPERVDAVDLDTATVTTFATLAARPVAIRAVALPGAAALVAARSDGVVDRLDLATGSVEDDADIASVVALGGGAWAYVLTGDAAKWHAAPLSVRRLGDGPGPGVGIEGTGRTITVAPDGGTVYVAHAAAAGAPDPGGVVVFAVSTDSCREGWDALPVCAGCDEPDCVPIATIRGYQRGFDMLDAEDPPTDPADDAAAQRARIDNEFGRVRLRSTAELEDAIDALFDGCGGGGGGPGEQGPKGEKGDKGEKGETGPRGPRGPAGADGTNGQDGQDGQDGEDGQDGQDGQDGADGEGLEKDLTQIIALNWHHAQKMLVQDLEMIFDPQTGEGFHGFVIQFSREVFTKPLDAEHIFTVDAPNPFAADEARKWFRCRCAIRGRVVPVAVTSVDATGRIDKAEILPGAGTADAIAFLLEREFVGAVLLERRLDDLWIRLQGEFVVDIDQRAVDAEFTRAELPSGDRPSGSAFGVQGGLFQSWFEPTRG